MDYCGHHSEKRRALVWRMTRKREKGKVRNYFSAKEKKIWFRATKDGKRRARWFIRRQKKERKPSIDLKREKRLADRLARNLFPP